MVAPLGGDTLPTPTPTMPATLNAETQASTSWWSVMEKVIDLNLAKEDALGKDPILYPNTSSTTTTTTTTTTNALGGPLRGGTKG
ncbi:hypothetical protein Pmar_PMAR019108 [Perkinsus marinus ATCC 50983]|uniref:Uncharacterized protein n=1 Tax=Perkinsus marinus (strain ATCC 50983 / TXsc) TaxID=423536 RepID=C5KTW2_PERM5|nr:hypothetical protein Pmar_PMAR019108 [Perkinsus marinus ATCC 50983]EER12004.1 hypothetical protein Pmar_PMAR019108 [Perkinsus marinus ATCC 50983]|eukprot:XP_002780209.1 hypothetical protein Pmar_PMAR019108 [Perkinsus marinus ATCC 50983]